MIHYRLFICKIMARKIFLNNHKYSLTIGYTYDIITMTIIGCYKKINGGLIIYE